MLKQETPSLWCAYHIPSKKSLEGLLFDEMRAIATATEEQKNWLIWKEGWPDWRLMTEYEGFEEALVRPLSIASPPAIPETYLLNQDIDPEASQLATVHNIKSVVSEEITEVDDSNSLINLVDEAIPFNELNYVQRKSKRFPRRYEITILFGKQEFKTHSVDVSIGGLKLEKSLPDWVGLQFKLRIKKGKNKIELLAYRIQSKHDPNVRFRVGFLPLKNEKDESQLEGWLTAA